MSGIKAAASAAAVLCLGIVALSLATPSDAAARKPALPTPKCAITGVKYLPAHRRIIGQGNCSYKLIVKTAKGKKTRLVHPTGRKWSFSSLKVYDQSGALCKVPAVFGPRNTFVVQKGVNKVTVMFKLSVAKNRFHQASRVTAKTATKVLGGKTAVCSAPPVVAPEGANSPTGSNNGYDTSDPSRGFNCGFVGGVTVDASGIHVPKIDCSGNGTCKWVSGGSVHAYGMALTIQDAKCSNGTLASPEFEVHLSYSDGSSCVFKESDISTLPIASQDFSGTMSGSVNLETVGADGMPLTQTWPTINFGPIVGTGTTRLC